jgi:hypothetical protein
LSLIAWRAEIASSAIGVVAAGITFDLMWPIMGDPYLMPLLIGAVLLVGTAIGGTSYLFLSVKR